MRKKEEVINAIKLLAIHLGGSGQFEHALE